MIFIILALLLASCAVSACEAIIERDWPRDTIRFPVTFAFILVIALAYA